MEREELREQAMGSPKQSGVYQFLDGDTVIYVGKAVDLRARIRSYIEPRSERIERMVTQATDIEISVTSSETQAVLLEANLIKRHQPRYNVRLTDDKSYPLIQLTAHQAPRIEMTRDPDEDAVVFGPFTNVGTVEQVLKAAREVYGLRGCSDHKYSNRERPCQDHEIGLCSAPCTGEVSEEQYRRDVENVREFLEGAPGIVAEPLENRMEEAASRHQYERAANLRDRLNAVENLHEGGREAIIARDEDRAITDVLGVNKQGEQATVARLRAEGGKLVDRSRHQLDTPAQQSADSVLAAFVPQFYSGRELPDRLLLSDALTDDEVESWLNEQGVELNVPGAGREGKLVELALQNARRGFNAGSETRELAHRLGVETVRRIEGFDVSHSHGTEVVGSNVVFVDGEAEKSDYRRKRLTDENDDYQNLRRLVEWRARRAAEGRDTRPDPDLLLIDGGEAQLSAAQDALQQTHWNIPVTALAKGEERVHTEEETFQWDSAAPALHLLQRVRDEAHRFAVQYHQILRDDIRTVLDEVPGVGETRAKRLLRRFGSVKGIREASESELKDVDGIGDETAAIISGRL